MLLSFPPWITSILSLYTGTSCPEVHRADFCFECASQRWHILLSVEEKAPAEDTGVSVDVCTLSIEEPAHPVVFDGALNALDDGVGVEADSILDFESPLGLSKLALHIVPFFRPTISQVAEQAPSVVSVIKTRSDLALTTLSCPLWLPWLLRPPIGTSSTCPISFLVVLPRSILESIGDSADNG